MSNHMIHSLSFVYDSMPAWCTQHDTVCRCSFTTTSMSERTFCWSIQLQATRIKLLKYMIHSIQNSQSVTQRLGWIVIRTHTPARQYWFNKFLISFWYWYIVGYYHARCIPLLIQCGQDSVKVVNAMSRVRAMNSQSSKTWSSWNSSQILKKQNLIEFIMFKNCN